MLHVLDHAPPTIADARLRAMFAARKSVFVDLLRWDVPVHEGRYEIDQFDDAHATYLILTGPGGVHLGSARLLETTRAHILGDLFPTLCDGPPPRGPAIREITRFCLDRTVSGRLRRRVRDTLIAGLVDHALASGIRAFTAIAERGWTQQILTFGWRCRLLGAPAPGGGSALAALRIDIDRSTPARLARAGIVARDLRACAPELPGEAGAPTC